MFSAWGQITCNTTQQHKHKQQWREERDPRFLTGNTVIVLMNNKKKKQKKQNKNTNAWSRAQAGPTQSEDSGGKYWPDPARSSGLGRARAWAQAGNLNSTVVDPVEMHFSGVGQLSCAHVNDTFTWFWTCLLSQRLFLLIRTGKLWRYLTDKTRDELYVI